jgi:hypothetical protein
MEMECLSIREMAMTTEDKEERKEKVINKARYIVFLLIPLQQ